MAVLRSERTYPLTLKGTAQYALNTGITAAYDFQGNPDSSYAGGNGAPHVGSKSYTAPASTPLLVEAAPGIFGRDPSLGATTTNVYSGFSINDYGIGSADGKANFTIHRRYRTPSIANTTIGRNIARYRDSGNTKITIVCNEVSAGYFYFRVEALAVSVPPSADAVSNVAIRRAPNTIVDLHIVRNGDNVSLYLDGTLVNTQSVPTLTTLSAPWGGSLPNNGNADAPARDFIMIDETYWNRALTGTEVTQHRTDPYAGYVNSAVVPDGINVTNPSAGTTINSEGGFTIGGTYAGSTVPTGFEYRFNGGAWVALTGTSITGGVFSGTGSAVTPATGLLEVRMANATGIAASVNNITAKPPVPTVSITSQPPPSGQEQQFILAITRTNKVAITLTANGNGAVTQGPTEFNVSGASADVSMTGIVAGDYTVSILATGDGGTASITGAPLSILGVGGGGTPGEGEAPAATAPVKPTSVSATAGNGTVSVTGTVASDGGSAITSYRAVASTGETGTSATLPVPVVVPNGVAVTFRLQAENAIGWSELSDPSNSVTPTIPVQPPTVTSVVVTPSTAQAQGGAQQQFSAQVNGTNSPSQSVSWATTAGSINQSGLFVAPVVQSAQSVTITATSTFDPSKSGSALVTVNPIPDVVYELESESPSVIVRVGSSDRLRLSLTFTDAPAPRGRTVTIGGASTTITSG